MIPRIHAVVIAAVLSILSAGSAGASPQITQFCGDHVCSGQAAASPYAVPRAAGAGARNHLRTAHHSHRSPKTSQRASQGVSGPGLVRSNKTGATAQVSPAYAPRFQAYIDDLEARGATVRFMGGYRRGPCWSGGQHPCGKALDVCQLDRGVVDGRCNLPGRSAMIEIARAHGLQEGGEWCNSDKGHVQVDVSAARCGSNLYAAVAKFKAGRVEIAARSRPKHRHHRIRLARR